jgi:predicted RNase H-like nuclease (RuvC/YqgF family)
MLIPKLKGPDGKIDEMKVLKRLDVYEDRLDQAEADLSTGGKTLEKCNRENSSLFNYYESRRAEIAAIVKFIELSIEQLRGEIYVKLTNANPRDMTERAKERLIDSNERVGSLCELLIEAKRVHDQYAGIVESFRGRGFRLKDITTLRVNEIHNDVL